MAYLLIEKRKYNFMNINLLCAAIKLTWVSNLFSTATNFLIDSRTSRFFVSKVAGQDDIRFSSSILQVKKDKMFYCDILLRLRLK